ncbi:ABC transporter permease subunit [Komagataeibacter swingsii]|uniref:ABC transporter permease n=1 Tax=Komagataeibacter swingsii TaxID=215220 RepID=A0A2V4S821_9PROT|nr:ABC transporter permease subunit [Komagataeibacter swingsii]PYD68198.1 ABC transporter permease [Komagataeibacter swingsii]GBQ57514.1 putative ABC transporter permease [Komagataeibacter swingsii DSM 16373]
MTESTSMRARLVGAGFLAPAVVYLMIFFVVPLFQLFWGSVTDNGGSLSPVHYQRFFSVPVFVRLLGTTLLCALVVAGFSAVLGYPVVRFVAGQPASRRRWLMLLIILPLWSSFMARTFGWIVILGYHGALNDFLLRIGLISHPVHFLYNRGAVLLGMTHSLLPIFMLNVLPVMLAISPVLPRAAMTLGAGAGTALWRLVLPLSAPGFSAGFLLVFMAASSFFIVPELLGGAGDILMPQLIIAEVEQTLNWHFAACLCVIMIVATFVCYGGLSRLFSFFPPRAGGGVERVLSVLGHGSDRVIERLGGLCRFLPGMFSGAVFVFLFLPILILVSISFTSGDLLDWPPKGLSLRWYRTVLHDPLWVTAAWRSLRVAVISALIATAIGSLAAVGLARLSRRQAAVIMFVLMAPLVTPHIAIGVSLYRFFSGWGMIGSDMAIVLGHVIGSIPYCVMSLSASFRYYDPQYDRAAATLGAPAYKRFFRIILPLVMPGLLAAFLFAFTLSFDELTVALFVTGGMKTTLPKQMWDSAVLSVDPSLAVVSTLLLGVNATMALVATALSRQQRPAG